MLWYVLGTVAGIAGYFIYSIFFKRATNESRFISHLYRCGVDYHKLDDSTRNYFQEILKRIENKKCDDKFIHNLAMISLQNIELKAAFLSPTKVLNNSLAFVLENLNRNPETLKETLMFLNDLKEALSVKRAKMPISKESNMFQFIENHIEALMVDLFASTSSENLSV